MKKKIIWIYFVYSDINSHITTWREMYYQLRDDFCIHYILPLNKKKVGFTNTIHFVKTSKVFGARRFAFSILGFFEFIRLYKKLKPEFVILDDWSFYYSVVRSFSKHKAKFVFDSRTPLYGQWKQEWKTKLIKVYIKNVLKYNKKFHDGLTCISNELRDLYEKDFKIQLNPFFCEWPSGVNLADFDPTRYPASENNGSLKMIFHGSITNTRGLENMIDALFLLDKDRINFNFSIYGDGAYVSFLQKRIQDHNLNNKISIMPPVSYSQVPVIIAKHDLAVMSYPRIDYWEGNVPLKLLEYIAMKKFVLCTNLNSFKRMAGNYPKIIFINDNKPELIKEGIIKCLQIRKSSADTIKVNTLLEQYSWRKIASDFKEFLLKL